MDATYTGLDYSSILDALLLRLQKQYGAVFNDAVESSPTMMLLDLVTVAVDMIAFAMDRRAADVYAPTARSRAALQRILAPLGYKMGPAIASTVDLQVSLKAPVGFPVALPARFQFKGPNALIFEASQGVTFAPGAGPADYQIVSCYQGETTTETFTGTGEANLRVPLRKVPSTSFIAARTVEVTVNGTPWPEVDLLEFGATPQVQVDYAADPPVLLFGDGNAGLAPDSGDTILVTYVLCRGQAGQVASGTITGAVKPLVVNFQPIPLVVNNPLAADPGADAETMDHARVAAGKVYKTRDVAVTVEDYVSAAEGFQDALHGRVATAQAAAARSAAEDLTLKQLLRTIATQIGAAYAAVQAAATAIRAACTALADSLDSYGATVSQVAAANQAAVTAQSAAIVSLRSAKNHYSEVSAAGSTINQVASSLSASISAFSTATPSQLSSGDKTALLDAVNRISAKVLAQSSEATSANSDIASALASVGTAQTSSGLIGVDTTTPGSYAYVLARGLAAQGTAVGGIIAQAGTAGDAVTAQDAAVTQALAAIQDHVDSFLAADGRANLVVVSILSLDAAGFYAAPTVGLIRALQASLAQKREATTSVSVVSGAASLVPAALTVRLGVRGTVTRAAAQAQAQAKIDAVLRGRKFGASLYVSDLDVIDSIDGFKFKNLKIDGILNPDLTLNIGQMDPDGNLIIMPSQVITKGRVTISVEVA